MTENTNEDKPVSNLEVIAVLAATALVCIAVGCVIVSIVF